MTKYITPANTAKELRKALKAAFPGDKFSVRTSVYAGGASINVSYEDGPAVAAVEKVAKSFAGASFDGMIDLKSHHSSQYEGETVHWGADYVFVNRDYSLAIAAEAKQFVMAALQAENDYADQNRFYDVPQAIYNKATIENGGKDGKYEYSYTFSHRETSVYSLCYLVSSMLVAEQRLLVVA